MYSLFENVEAFNCTFSSIQISIRENLNNKFQNIFPVTEIIRKLSKMFTNLKIKIIKNILKGTHNFVVTTEQARLYHFFLLQDLF